MAQIFWISTTIGGFILEHFIYTFVFGDFFLGIAPEISLLIARTIGPNTSPNFRQFITLTIVLIVLAFNVLSYAKILLNEFKTYWEEQKQKRALAVNRDENRGANSSLNISQTPGRSSSCNGIILVTSNLELCHFPNALPKCSREPEMRIDCKKSTLKPPTQAFVQPEANSFNQRLFNQPANNNSEGLTDYNPVNHKSVLNICQTFILFGCSISIVCLNLSLRYIFSNKAEAEVINLAFTDPLTSAVLVPSAFVAYNADLRNFAKLKVMKSWSVVFNAVRALNRSNSVVPVIVVT